MSLTNEIEIVATLAPMHPGEVLREEFMVPMNLTAYAVAKACRIPRNRIERIVREDLGISGDTALRLGKVFAIDPRFWINLQARYELDAARLKAAELDQIEPIAA